MLTKQVLHALLACHVITREQSCCTVHACVWYRHYICACSSTCTLADNNIIHGKYTKRDSGSMVSDTRWSDIILSCWKQAKCRELQMSGHYKNSTLFLTLPSWQHFITKMCFAALTQMCTTKHQICLHKITNNYIHNATLERESVCILFRWINNGPS